MIEKVERGAEGCGVEKGEERIVGCGQEVNIWVRSEFGEYSWRWGGGKRTGVKGGEEEVYW